jgi:hypothetical protein
MFVFPSMIAFRHGGNNHDGRKPGQENRRELAAPAQIRELLFEKREPVLEGLAIAPLATGFQLTHHAGALEQEAIALTLIIHLLRG